MAIVCPACGHPYDVTLFSFGQTVECDCGAVIGLYGETSGPGRGGGPVEIPIDGILDLHAFDPAEVGDLVPEYLRVCLEKGLHRVRIIHGKGTGALMLTVRAVLGRIPEVASFEPAGPLEGGTGATIVRLRGGEPAPATQD